MILRESEASPKSWVSKRMFGSPVPTCGSGSSPFTQSSPCSPFPPSIFATLYPAGQHLGRQGQRQEGDEASSDPLSNWKKIITQKPAISQVFFHKPCKNPDWRIGRPRWHWQLHRNRPAAPVMSRGVEETISWCSSFREHFKIDPCPTDPVAKTKEL